MSHNPKCWKYVTEEDPQEEGDEAAMLTSMWHSDHVGSSSLRHLFWNSMPSPLPDEYDAAKHTGRWLYGPCLGSGGLALVYRVRDMTGALGEVALKVLRSRASCVHAFELHREAQWSITRLHRETDPRYDAEGAGLFVRYLEDHSGFENDGWPGLAETLGAEYLTSVMNLDPVQVFERRRNVLETPSFDWKRLGPAAHRPYVVLELLTGCTMHVSLRVEDGNETNPRMDEAEQRAALLQLGRACVYLVSFGLVHRDIRACNIQLCKRSPCKSRFWTWELLLQQRRPHGSVQAPLCVFSTLNESKWVTIGYHGRSVEVM